MLDRKNTYVILDWKRRHPQSADPDHYLIHFRILGACERGTKKIVIAPAELKVLPGACQPPQDSIREIMASSILQRIRAKTACHADGCKVWKGSLQITSARKTPQMAQLR